MWQKARGNVVSSKAGWKLVLMRGDYETVHNLFILVKGIPRGICNKDSVEERTLIEIAVMQLPFEEKKERFFYLFTIKSHDSLLLFCRRKENFSQRLQLSKEFSFPQRIFPLCIEYMICTRKQFYWNEQKDHFKQRNFFLPVHSIGWIYNVFTIKRFKLKLNMIQMRHMQIWNEKKKENLFVSLYGIDNFEREKFPRSFHDRKVLLNCTYGTSN